MSQWRRNSIHQWRRYSIHQRRRNLIPISLALMLVSSLSGLAQAAELTVSAAASLSNVFKDLAPLFEAAQPGHKLQFNFAASGALLQQIDKGAPVDVFASADVETMDQAQRKGLVLVAQRRNFVSNTLALVVPIAGTEGPIGGTQGPKALAELTQPRYARIAIGLPASVPVGRYTQGALKMAGLWSAIESKLISAHSVRQVLDYVARGEVDAGFVYTTDAMLMAGKVRLALTVPTPTPIVYPVAVLARSPHPELAQRFVEFLSTAPAQAVLTRHGFGKP